MTASSAVSSSIGRRAYTAVLEPHDKLLGLLLQQSATLGSDDVGDTGFPVKLAEEALSKVDPELVIAFAVGAAAEDAARDDAPRRPTASSDNPGTCVEDIHAGSSGDLPPPGTARQ